MGRPTGAFGVGTNTDGQISESFTDITGVGQYFVQGSEPYRIAAAYFATGPITPKPLRMAGYSSTEYTQPGNNNGVTGSTVTQLASNTANPLEGRLRTAGGSAVDFEITFNDVPGAFGNWDSVSSVGELEAFALAVERAVLASGGTDTPGFTFRYDADNTRFVIDFGFNAQTGDLYPALVVAPNTGNRNDLLELAGLLPAVSSIVTGNAPATSPASVAAFFDDLVTEANDFYFVLPDHTFTDPAGDNNSLLGGINGIASVAGGLGKMTLVDLVSPEFTTGDPTSPADDIPGGTLGQFWSSNSSNDRVVFFYTPHSTEYPSAAVAKLFANADFNIGNSYLTAKFKSLPGITPAVLSAAQIDVLKARNINHYITIAGSINMMQEGTTAKAGIFIDMRYFLDWFTATMQSSVFATLAGAQYIPQTEEGMLTLEDAVRGVCDSAVASGAIGSGTFDFIARDEIRRLTGNPSFSGVTTKGYVIWRGPISSLRPEQRTAREVPPFHVWLKGSGAVHFVDISVVFDN